MLRVVDLASGATLSCSLTPESTAAQVVVALRRRRSTLADEDATWSIYGVWADTKQRLRARKLRMDSRPLLLVSHLKRTTGAAPKLLFAKDGVSCRLILAKTSADEEERLFSQKGITLENKNDSDFFTVIERLGDGDLCGYLFTNSTDAVTSKTESFLKWWVLHGERLWSQTSHEINDGDDKGNFRQHVSLANNTVTGPWSTEFALQTPLATFRLIAPNAADARTWVDTISKRITLATDNEMIMFAEILVADEEKARWRKYEARVSTLDSLDAWLESTTTINQLCKFARTDGSEYLLLFYIDARSAAENNETINPIPHIRRFLSLATIPDTLLPLRTSLSNKISDVTQSSVLDNTNSINLGDFLQLLDSVRQELENGMMKRLVGNRAIFEKYVSEVPLGFVNELYL